MIHSTAGEPFYEFVSTPGFEASAKGLLTEEDRRHLELLLLSRAEENELRQLAKVFEEE